MDTLSWYWMYGDTTLDSVFSHLQSPLSSVGSAYSTVSNSLYIYGGFDQGKYFRFILYFIFLFYFGMLICVFILVSDQRQSGLIEYHVFNNFWNGSLTPNNFILPLYPFEQNSSIVDSFPAFINPDYPSFFIPTRKPDIFYYCINTADYSDGTSDGKFLFFSYNTYQYYHFTC